MFKYIPILSIVLIGVGKMTVNQENCEQAAVASSKSALQANIEEKGNNAYYYAHAKKVTGEQPAPPPVHVVLETRVEQLSEPVDTIFNYQFLDEDKHAKVYIPLEGVGAAIENNSISLDCQMTSLTVNIRDYKPGRVLRLLVRELHGEVEPDACSFKKLANKVVVTLKKREKDGGSCSKWQKLTK